MKKVLLGVSLVALSVSSIACSSDGGAGANFASGTPDEAEGLPPRADWEGTGTHDPNAPPPLTIDDNVDLQATATPFAGASKSCGTAGAGINTCGGAKNEDCCTSLPVPGGSYKRYNNSKWPATVSAFTLDKFEITQGRLRAYLASVGWNPRSKPPVAGAGANPKIPNSGWRSEWNVRLPANQWEINDRFTYACADGGDNANGWGAATWVSHTSKVNDEKPVTCVDWYTLLAFCIWDGGRLPTAAEWGFAAQGGSEQRPYAWTKTAPVFDFQHVSNYLVHMPVSTDVNDPFCPWGASSTTHCAFTVGTHDRRFGDGPAHIAWAGSKPAGNGKWGHSDLNGSLLEWTFDTGTTTEPATCTDCASMNWEKIEANPSSYPQYYDNNGKLVQWAGTRNLRGGSWERHDTKNNQVYRAYPTYRTYYAAGARCAR